MKRIKIVFLFVILAMAAVLGACNFISDDFEFKDYDDFKKSVKNYSMTITSNDQTVVIKVCEDGYLYESGSSIYFYNGEEKKGYYLNKDDKTGIENTYEDGEELYDWESGGIIDVLYSFQILKLFMKKDGKGKVAGRNCAIYTYDKDGVKAKYWLDNEFGFCLKSEITEDGEIEVMEVTEFSIGNVTLENMIDLSSYTITEGGIIPAKTIESISVKSNTIPANKTPDNLALSSIKITVYYSDGANEDMPLTESMISSDDRQKLTIPGTHTITVNLGGKTTTFTITLIEEAWSNPPIVSSIQDFYSNVALDFESATYGFVPNLAINIALVRPNFENYYYESVEGKADENMWGAPCLLWDACFQIMYHLEGVFDEEEIDFGGGIKKTPSCVETASGYEVKYAQTKGLYKYWFETNIDYHEATNSLRAQIFCGVDAQQELKYIIEYNKTVDGYYMCLIHYPNEAIDGNPLKYTTLRLYFKDKAGKISINRWRNQTPAQLDLVFQKPDDASYADNGDAVITTDGDTVQCPIDNLKSGFYNDFNNLLELINATRNDVFDEESEEQSHIAYGDLSAQLIDIIENIYVGDYTIYEIIKSYDNKKELYIAEGVTLDVNRSDDTYVVAYEDEYGEIVVTVKYGKDGSFHIQKKTDGELELRFQWARIRKGKVMEDHFTEVFIKDSDAFIQRKYAFNNNNGNMRFVSIYGITKSIELDIYKAADLDINTFVPEPVPALFPNYDYFRYESGVLNYNYNRE